MQLMTVDLAKKDDLDVIKKEISATNDRVTEPATEMKETIGKLSDVGLRMTALERKVADLENKDGAPSSTRRSSGASRSSCTRRTSTASASANCGDEGELMARILHFRRSAPYKSGDTAKLDKREAEAVQEHRRLHLPEQWEDRVRFLTPFARSHSASSEGLASPPHDAKMLVDTMSMILKRVPFSVKGHEVREGLETCLGRKSALRSLFEARDWVNGLNQLCWFEECSRSVELEAKVGCVTIGWFCKVGTRVEVGHRCRRHDRRLLAGGHRRRGLPHAATRATGRSWSSRRSSTARRGHEERGQGGEHAGSRRAEGGREARRGCRPCHAHRNTQ